MNAAIASVSGPDTAIAGNDDSCGVQSEATFASTAGEQYLIRVGGYQTAVGTASMTIECVPGFICPADFNQDGGVDGADIAEFFGRWENGC